MEHIEFSRHRKTESVTLWTVHCRGKNKSLETGTPPALCVWHSVGGVFPCLSYEPVHLGAAFDIQDAAMEVHQTVFVEQLFTELGQRMIH